MGQGEEPGAGKTPKKIRRLRRSGQATRSLGSKAAAAELATESSEDPEDPWVGATIDGKYKVLERIGGTDTSRIYKTWHVMLEKAFALKLVPPASNDEDRERFLQEARTATELVHKHLATTREFGETMDGQRYVVMDFCPGHTLAHRVVEEGRLDPERASKLLCQVLEAVAEVHRCSLVLGDLRPSAVMVDEDDFARVIDSGLAGEEEGVGSLPRAPAYASPEHVEGGELGPQADVYSAGVILYELLTGALPFDGSPEEQFRLRLVQDPPPPDERVEGLELPADLRKLVMKALARRAEQRWQTASELRAALLGFLAGEAIDADMPTQAEAFELRTQLDIPNLAETGEVHRVRHRQLDREGLAWVLRVDGYGPETTTTFQSRLEVVRVFEHSALAPLLEAGAYAGRRLYALNGWVEGETVRERIDRGTMSEDQVVEFLRPLLEALDRAHEFGVTHEAIDPQIITLTEEGPVLHGLGILPAVRGGAGDPSRDVASLGRIGLALLAGRAGAATTSEALERASHGLRRALQKASGERPYANAGAFLEGLQDTRGPFPTLLVAAVSLLVLMVVAVAVSTRGTDPVVLGSSDEQRPNPQVFEDEEPEPPEGGDEALTEEVRVALAEVAAVRSGAIAMGAERTASRELAVADGRRLQLDGLKGAAVIREASMVSLSYTRVGRLAEGRAELEDLTRTMDQVAQEVDRLRQQGKEDLADVTAAEEFSAAEKALELVKARPTLPEPRKVAYGALAARKKDLEARLLTWQKTRDRYQLLVDSARRNHPRKAVDEARKAAVRAGADRLATQELAAADVAWKPDKDLRGEEGLVAARAAARRYANVQRLAVGRQSLETSAGKIKRVSLEAAEKRQRAQKSMADVHSRQAFQEADRMLAKARSDSKGLKTLLQVDLAGLPDAKARVSAILLTWRRARNAFTALAQSAEVVNEVKTLVDRVTNAIVRRKPQEVFALYQNPSVDRQFFKTLFEKAKTVRFRAATPVVKGTTARARVAQFSYQDGDGERVVLRGMRILMHKVGSRWRVVNLRVGR